MRHKHRENLICSVDLLPGVIGAWLIANKARGLPSVTVDPVFDVVEIKFITELDHSGGILGVLRHHLTRFHEDLFETTMAGIKKELEKWAS